MERNPLPEEVPEEHAIYIHDNDRGPSIVCVTTDEEQARRNFYDQSLDNGRVVVIQMTMLNGTDGFVATLKTRGWWESIAIPAEKKRKRRLR